jgi:NAD(P)-dependent dehydrogenase (short-subunit alcohol dehydrogenase family)
VKNTTLLITGANRGIGRQAALELARTGARIWIACRSRHDAERTKDELVALTGNVSLFATHLDLSSPGSIRECAAMLHREDPVLDVLINNAGLMARARTLTAAGVELTFAANVLGHHLLTRLLLDQLKRSPAPRVINVASDYAGGLEIDDINFDRRGYSLTLAYKQSKQANRMLTREWARRTASGGLSVYSMTPGFVPSTSLFREQSPAAKVLLRALAPLIGRSVEQGADTVVWLASTPSSPGASGAFFKDRREVACEFNDPAQERRLWEMCERLLAGGRGDDTHSAGADDPLPESQGLVR